MYVIVVFYEGSMVCVIFILLLCGVKCKIIQVVVIEFGWCNEGGGYGSSQGWGGCGECCGCYGDGVSNFFQVYESFGG